MASNDHISPVKCAVKYKPPLLAIIYKDLKTGKTRRRTIPLRGFTNVNDVKTYGDKLLRNPKHYDYVSKLPRQQLDSLLQKVKNAHNGQANTTNQAPSPAHSSLLPIPALATPTATPTHNEADILNKEFDDALAELLGSDDDDENLDVTIPADSSTLFPNSLVHAHSSTLPSPTTHTHSSALPSLGLTSPLGKLPPLDKLPPLKPPDLREEIGMAPVLQTKDTLAKDEDASDYSADFNSESERSKSAQPPAVEDRSLSFAIEELEDDGGSLSLSIEGENFAGDNPLGGSSSGEDFRAMTIVTPPAQAKNYHPILQAMVTGEEDLNKADNGYLAERKAEMDTVFKANQVKPGDEGYMYDKEIAFDGPKIESGWDSDNDSISDF